MTLKLRLWHMLIDKPQCDYLRLATFHPEHYQTLAPIVLNIPLDQDRRETRWLDYKGFGNKSNTAFAGQGTIKSGRRKGQWHSVAHLSGEQSNMLLQYHFPDEIYCTRIDLQVTVRCPEKYDAYKFHQDLEDEEIDWPARRRKPLLIKGPKGEGDSVYIGSRDSDKYIRVYEKFNEAGKRFLRLEVEYKRQRARNTYEYITARRQDTAIAFLLMSELDLLPRLEIVDFLKVALFLWSIQRRDDRDL